ncbi:hypothetical protein J5U23_01978 [Saccharolobus shibatae B12]|uniref:Uncharacterized protein n=1 Tax=Saccharolobus shibatae (strain ATCC 51178 / DSM 5389 / JCM 8931 / NBRC 15437 / B12) TaxID=523848 RepID=A0A8F5BPR8_SACSH|nr:hypothetical protein J5U23_01978 [Saccharolobus shibatae B12]
MGERLHHLWRWIALLYLNTALSRYPLVVLMTLLLRSIEGLMGLREEYLSPLLRG